MTTEDECEEIYEHVDLPCGEYCIASYWRKKRKEVKL